MKAVFILLGIGGLGAVCYGCWAIYPPLGWIISGISALLAGQGGYRLYDSRKKGGR